MPQISPELSNLLVQGGFAALFIWLLLRTQQRQDMREDRLIGTLDQYANKMPEIVRLLDSIEKRLQKIEGEQNKRG